MLRYVDDIYEITLVGGEYGFSINEWDTFKKDIGEFGILR